MAHEFESGMFVRTAAWHGLGNVLPEAPETWQEARQAAGLDWEPVEATGYAGIERVDEDGNKTMDYVPMPDHKVIVRSTDAVVLAPANKTYELIDHESMGLVIQTILQDRRYHFDALVSLQRGRKVAAVMELGDPFQINGDPSQIRRYGILLNAHDGSSACRFIAANIRVVCMNTWRLADAAAEQDGTAYYFQHSSGWKAKLDQVAKEARAAVQGAQSQVNEYRELCNTLADMQVRKDQVDRFIEEFVYPTAEEHTLTKIAGRNVAQGRTELRTILASETCHGIENTAYGLMQASGEWCDHVRPYKTKETFFGRSIVRTDELKQRGTRLAVAAAEGRL